MSTQVSAVGWTHKMAALVLHIACCALFYAVVVAPLVTGIRSGELAAELKLVVQAWRAFTTQVSAPR